MTVRADRSRGAIGKHFGLLPPNNTGQEVFGPTLTTYSENARPHFERSPKPGWKFVTLPAKSNPKTIPAEHTTEHQNPYSKVHLKCEIYCAPDTLFVPTNVGVNHLVWQP